MIPETMTPTVEDYAKSRGLTASVGVARQLIRQKVPSLTALRIDLSVDPDDGGEPTVCFTITTAESVERVLDLDNGLQAALYESLPTDHLPYLSFFYDFDRAGSGGPRHSGGCATAPPGETGSASEAETAERSWAGRLLTRYSGTC